MSGSDDFSDLKNVHLEDIEDDDDDDNGVSLSTSAGTKVRTFE